MSGIPELDLEPLFLALRDRMAGDQLDVWLDPPPESPPNVLADADELIDVDEPAAPEPVIEVPELEPVAARVGASTIEEILVAAGFPPSRLEGPAIQVGHAGAEHESGSEFEGSGGTGSTGADPPRAPAVDAPVIIPEAEPELGAAEAGDAVQAGILRWLLASTGGSRRCTCTGPRTETSTSRSSEAAGSPAVMSMVRRATEAAGGPIPPPEPDDATIVTRWGQTGEERVLVLSGAPAGAGDVTAFARLSSGSRRRRRAECLRRPPLGTARPW